eukprot:6565608-Prymnesium_polylepis.1
MLSHALRGQPGGGTHRAPTDATFGRHRGAHVRCAMCWAALARALHATAPYLPGPTSACLLYTSDAADDM